MESDNRKTATRESTWRFQIGQNKRNEKTEYFVGYSLGQRNTRRKMLENR